MHSRSPNMKRCCRGIARQRRHDKGEALLMVDVLRGSVHFFGILTHLSPRLPAHDDRRQRTILLLSKRISQRS